MPVTTSNGDSLVIVGDASVDNIKIDDNTISATNTNGNIVLQTNGTGALQRDSGGNIRGNYAVDLQNTRSNNTQVASGSYSVIGGGDSNNASGYASTVDGGLSNNASGFYSTVGGGDVNNASGYASTVDGGLSNNASGYASTVGGGDSNNASGGRSIVGGGNSNTASGYYSTVSGGLRGVASLYGEDARASGRFNTDGDAQVRRFILRKKQTNQTETDLSLNGINLGLTIPANTTWLYTIKIVGRYQPETMSFGYKIEGVIERNSLFSIILSKTITTLYEDDASYFVDLNIVNNDLDIICGTNSVISNMYWVAYAELIQVTVPPSTPSY